VGGRLRSHGRRILRDPGRLAVLLREWWQTLSGRLTVYKPPRDADFSELGITTVRLSPGFVLGGTEAVAADLNAAPADVLPGASIGRGHELRFV